MTEAEWLVSDDSPNWRSGQEAYFDTGSYQNKVGRMLRCLDGRSSQRKLLLFALICYGQNEDLFPDIRQRRAFALSESRVDGTITDQDRRVALVGVADAYEAMSTDGDFDDYLNAPAQVLELKFTVRFAEALSDLAGHSRDGEESFDGQREELFRDQIVLLRDIFGNPFRPVPFVPAWLTSTAVGIARGIYEDRAFDRLPILADALQDAGCEDAEVLGHCRGDGPHVRGCWVVDGVLGKR